MKKLIIAMTIAAFSMPQVAKGIEIEISPEKVVNELPAGLEPRNYLRDGELFRQWGSDAIKYETLQASLSSIAESDDGKVYISNAMSGLSECYLVGTRKDNTLTFAFPQIVKNGEEYLAVMRLEPTTIEIPDYDDYVISKPTFKVSSEKQEIEFNIEGGIWSQVQDIYFGYVNAQGEWTGYGELNQVFTPFDSKLVEVPADAEKFNVSIKYDDLSDYRGVPGLYKLLPACQKGNDFYIQGLSNQYPENWIAGTIDGDRITFKNGQFLGIGKWSIEYFCTGIDTPEYIPGYNTWEHHLSMNPELEMSYDPVTREIKALDKNDALMVNASPTSYVNGDVYLNAEFKRQPTHVDPTPLMPIFKRGENVWDNGFDPYLTFQILPLNIYGDLLDTSNIGFEIDTDGGPYLFSAETYWFDDNLTIVPWGVVSPFIEMYENGYTGIYFQDETFLRDLSIRTVNKIGEKIYYSDPQTPDSPKVQDPVSGIKIIPNESVSRSIKYFDMNGNPVVNPKNGIFIRQTMNEDGTLNHLKIVL
ncbi:MAG: hypothetical protein K2G23_05095 [Muribaculaceae bacterium]|nr:hypothetical protein [Muribaculaceae bacterium]